MSELSWVYIIFMTELRLISNGTKVDSSKRMNQLATHFSFYFLEKKKIRWIMSVIGPRALKSLIHLILY